MLAKFDLKIYYPPPYLQEVWLYQEMNTNFIRQAINNFNCEKTFSDANINEVVSLFNKLIFNIFNNYIPHETITCDDKDFPWLTSWFKSLIESKNTCHKNYLMYQTIAHLLIKLNLLQE